MPGKTPEQKAFEAELLARLRQRASLLLATDQAVLRELLAAKAHILEILAQQPADWQQWHLGPLLEQIKAVLEGAAGRSALATDAAQRSAWQQGEDLVDKPLHAAGYPVEMQLPALDVAVLQQLRAFTTLALKDVAAEAAQKIGRQLSLVTIGSQTPFQAIKAIQEQLGNDTPRRATTIVRTEVGAALAIAQDQRLQQAAALVPGLGKQWRRSGKIHSRWNHDAVDGQVQPAAKPFVLPSLSGPLHLRFPHDPAAPLAERINCGCVAVPHLTGLQFTTPGARPFSALELQLDPRKAALQQAALRAGLRKS